MFENIVQFFRGLGKKEKDVKSKDAAKERLHLVLMQDRANISADFLALMKQEIIEVIKKYIDVDENAIDVRLTNKSNDDGTTGAPVLYANIPIMSVKEEAKSEARKVETSKKAEVSSKRDSNKEDNKENLEKKSTKINAKEERKLEVVEISKKAENDENTNAVIEQAEEIVEEIKEKTK